VYQHAKADVHATKAALNKVDWEKVADTT
jgi:hypothetical protein